MAETAAETYRDQWMKNVYDKFRESQRRNIFMSIAVFCFHNQPIEGYYLEFGSHTARTMRLAWDAFHALYDFNYVSFDSFEGLPELAEIDRMPIWKKGALKTSEEDFLRIMREHGMPREKLVTVKGFYNDTLTEELKQKMLPTKAAVIYVDCDLYESTATVLRFAKDFLQRGTVIVFDDWFCFYGDPERGERRAFNEFVEQNPNLIFQDYIQTNEAKAFIFLGERGEEAKR